MGQSPVIIVVMRSFLAAALTFAIVPAQAGPVASALDAGYRQMYNLDFGGAHRTFASWKKAHPDDPLGPVSDAAAYLFAELDRLSVLQGEFFADDSTFLKPKRLSPDPMAKAAFLLEIEGAERSAKAVLARSPRDANARFAAILALGLRSDYLGLIEKSYVTSLSSMKASRLAAETLLSIDGSYYDAYLAIGVENYMLSLKPAPIRWLLRLGGAATDRDEGVKQLRITAEKGYYLKPFARLLMAVAALRDKDIATARGILQSLSKEYPGNRLYSEELAKLKVKLK